MGAHREVLLSPLLWTLAADELMYLLNDKGLRTDGFADDLFTLLRGFDPSVMSDQLQNVCRIIERWCSESDLRVNPDKVNLVIFTRKRDLTGYRRPTLYGKVIKEKEDMKYLGVNIDKTLTWEKHLEYISNKALGVLFMCKKMIGNKWGLKPSMMKWMYTTIIRPMTTYAAQVWNRKSSRSTEGRRVTHTKLQKVQRLALLLITGAMKTTPTDALEAILNIPPLFLIIESEAIIIVQKQVN